MPNTNTDSANSAPKPSKAVTAVAAVIVLILIFAIARCGGDDDEPTAEPTPTPSATSDSAEPDNEELAADIEASLKESLGGVKRFSQTCPDVGWACTISNIETRHDVLFVTEQISGNDKEFGEHAGRAICNFIGGDYPDIGWVEVRNASGSTIGNVQCA